MDHKTLVKVLNLIRPGCQYNIREKEDGTNSIEWGESNSQTAPTDQELANGLTQVGRLSYREQRAPEYPSLGDQIDALWKGGQAQTDMLAQIQAVKIKYPKPS